MNSKIVIVIMFQLLLACAALDSQATALDRAQDPEQLWNIGWELSQDSFNHRDTLRMKDNRQALLRNRGRIHSLDQHSDLLQELLTPGDSRHETTQMMTKTKKQY